MKTIQRLYLDLMKRCLTDDINGNNIEESEERKAIQEGRIWPVNAYTMIGQKRLDNIEFCIEDILTRHIPGDLMETGVWRGGATIFMRAVLRAFEITDRCVWVADSFEGLPQPNPGKYPADIGDQLFMQQGLAISLAEVRQNFQRFELLDDQVKFLKGWFRDTLPNAPIGSLALLRLDGDMYESTMDALVNLYPKLSVGGYLIVDDYGGISACRQAVQDYRDLHGIVEPMLPVDWTGVYWKRGGDANV